MSLAAVNRLLAEKPLAEDPPQNPGGLAGIIARANRERDADILFDTFRLYGVQETEAWDWRGKVQPLDYIIQGRALLPNYWLGFHSHADAEYPSTQATCWLVPMLQKRDGAIDDSDVYWCLVPYVQHGRKPPRIRQTVLIEGAEIHGYGEAIFVGSVNECLTGVKESLMWYTEAKTAAGCITTSHDLDEMAAASARLPQIELFLGK